MRVIRPLSEEEVPLLQTYLYHAIFVPQGLPAPDLSILDDPELQVYVQGFGTSPADICMVCEEDGSPVGAAWVRIMNDYGHIDDTIPSLAISVLPAYRSTGIGTSLLEALANEVRHRGYASISLSVQDENPARKLYERLGWHVIQQQGSELLMLRDL